MPMRVKVIVATLVIGVLTSRGALADQALAPWIGTWTLDLAKSTYNPGPPPFKRAMCVIEPWQDGLRVTYDMVRPRGGITHLEWRGRFDGHDYPVEGVDRVVTNAYRQVADRTYKVITKVDGEVTEQARIAISPDGRTITTVTIGKNAQGQDATTVYDKQ